MAYPQKARVVGVGISATTYEESLSLLASRQTPSMVVSVCNVHSVMSARRDSNLREALETADIATPDGMPLVWGLRLLFDPEQKRVYGPELMRMALLGDALQNQAHFLYGSSDETLEALQLRIAREAPHTRIAGAYSPPFRVLTAAEEEADAQMILESGADVVWVGLGMPKQELWMHRNRKRLPGVHLVGVGAAFDFLAGTKKQAPEWMQRSGLEWLYRLLQEPRRLWRRYVWNNPAFLVLLGAQVVSQRLSTRRRTPGPNHVE